ncbi:MAG: hypothetical protein M1836_001486 [Candelina mexicana]|nr:MAG: hypothetical protein M1836_001486 [Candelina mexicana]
MVIAQSIAIFLLIISISASQALQANLPPSLATLRRLAKRPTPMNVCSTGYGSPAASDCRVAIYQIMDPNHNGLDDNTYFYLPPAPRLPNRYTQILPIAVAHGKHRQVDSPGADNGLANLNLGDCVIGISFPADLLNTQPISARWETATWNTLRNAAVSIIDLCMDRKPQAMGGQVKAGDHSKIIVQILGPNSGTDRQYQALRFSALERATGSVDGANGQGDGMSPTVFEAHVCVRTTMMECDMMYADDCVKFVNEMSEMTMGIVYGVVGLLGVESCG